MIVTNVPFVGVEDTVISFPHKNHSICPSTFSALSMTSVCVQRGLVGEIISRFEKRGFQLRALKVINVERSLAETHYSDLSSKPFFKDLVRS
jgi:hypothetical protein